MSSRNWHPENLRRGRQYALHIGGGGTMEIVRMIFDDIVISDRILMVRGQNVLTKEDTIIPVNSVLEVQAAH
jgi:hypothetical protein